MQPDELHRCVERLNVRMLDLEGRYAGYMQILQTRIEYVEHQLRNLKTRVTDTPVESTVAQSK